MPGVTDDLMAQALGAAFSKVLEDALQPLVIKIADLQAQILAMSNQQQIVMDMIETVKTKGGFMAKQLGLS